MKYKINKLINPSDLRNDQSIIVNLSGRGDKDVQQVFEMNNQK